MASVDVESAKRTKGEVVWFNARYGYGWISYNGSNNDAYVQFSDIVGDGFKRLNEGQQVEFKLVEQGNGDAKAVEVTGPGGEPIKNDLKRGGSRDTKTQNPKPKGDEPVTEGEVVWFDPQRGFGWIAWGDFSNDAYVSYEDIIGGE